MHTHTQNMQAHTHICRAEWHKKLRALVKDHIKVHPPFPAQDVAAHASS